MKKHDLQIDGQINLFDLLESVENTQSDISSNLRTSWDDMTEDELFEEIIKECDLKKYDIEEWQIDIGETEKDTRTAKTLKFKINQTDFKIGPFSHYAEDVRGGRRFVSCDYDYKRGGGGTPAESITEVINFIRRESKNGKPDKEAEEFPPIIKELSERLHKLFENQKTYNEEYEVWEHVPSLGKRYSLFVRKIENVPREELDEIEEEFKKYNLEIKDSFAGWDEEDNIKIAITTMWTTKGHKENLEELKVTLPLKKTFCSVIGADCGMHTYKGCKIPEQCEHMKAAVADRQEIETLKEDIETIEDKIALWVWSDYLPYIVKQIVKDKDWVIESVREFTYNKDKDYHKPLDVLFTKTGYDKTSYKFMVDDTEFELAPSIYEEVYFIRCSKILDSQGNLLTQTNITAKDIVLELMKQPRPVDIRGICDDAYCPECDFSLDHMKYLDCEKCPDCGTLINWAPWHRYNKEIEDEKVNS